METTNIINNTRELLSNGETGKAFQILIAALSQQNNYAQMLQSLRVGEANYNNVKQQELKGILSFSEAQREYAKSNELIFNTLQTLENGSSAGISQKRNYKWIILPILGVLGCLVCFFYPRTNCPTFDSNKRIKIMLLPFQNVGDRKAKPELVLQTKIRTITSKNNLSTDVEILNDFNVEKENPDFDDANQLGIHCCVNLVVWGQYSVGADSSHVNIQYKSILDGSSGESDFQAVKDVTALQGGQMKKNLEDVVLSLCTMIAIREHRMDKAEEWLLKIKEKDSNDLAMLDWVNKNKK
jgi:hypothetical protein